MTSVSELAQQFPGKKAPVSKRFQSWIQCGQTRSFVFSFELCEPCYLHVWTSHTTSFTTKSCIIKSSTENSSLFSKYAYTKEGSAAGPSNQNQSSLIWSWWWHENWSNYRKSTKKATNNTPTKLHFSFRRMMIILAATFPTDAWKKKNFHSISSASWDIAMLAGMSSAAKGAFA